MGTKSIDSLLGGLVIKIIVLAMGTVFTIMGGFITYFTWGSYDEMRGMRQDTYELKVEFSEYKYMNNGSHDTLKLILSNHLLYSSLLNDTVHSNNDSISELRMDVNSNTLDIKEVKRSIGLF